MIIIIIVIEIIITTIIIITIIIIIITITIIIITTTIIIIIIIIIIRMEISERNTQSSLPPAFPLECLKAEVDDNIPFDEHSNSTPYTPVSFPDANTIVLNCTEYFIAIQ